MISIMQDPCDYALVHPVRADPLHEDPREPSQGRAGELRDPVEELGEFGAALVGPKAVHGGGPTLVGAGGVEGRVGVEEGVPVGERGFEVAEA